MEVDRKMLWIGIAIVIAIALFFLRFTLVEEGTAKIIMRFKGVAKVFIQWTGYKLTPEGKVEAVTLAKRPWYGGLRIWVGTPFDKVYKYDLRWHSVEETQGKRVPVFREKKDTDYVNLRPDRYWRKSPRVETSDGQFPDVEWLIGVRSINPEKTIFKSPHNWVENALTQLEPLLRGYVYTKTLKELLELTREQIWENIGADRAIQTVLKEEWGIQIDDKEIGVFDVAPPPEYQEALAAESKAVMKATAARRTAEIEAKARAAETVGTVIEMMATVRGKTLEEIQTEINSKPEMQKEFSDLAKDLIVRKIGIEGGAYVDIRIPELGGGGGGEGSGFLERTIEMITRAIITAIAAQQRMPMGPRKKEIGKEEKQEKQEKQEREPRKGQLTEEEKRRIDEEIRKKREREKA